MKWRGSAVALSLAGIAAVTAGVSYGRASKLRSEGQWLWERGSAQAQASVESRDGTMVRTQSATFERRRTVIEASYRWQRVQMISIMVSVTAAFCAYILHLIFRLREQLVEGGMPLEEEL
ncbi:MAG TPA: hypothetical protein VEY30_12960 [Myxococcaceae bacterium]|nr:hypothetical protein [Myxococcaceae bacterium]